jgi:iron complex outermembrane receptor protein
LTDGAKFSSYQVEKASFLNLDNATLGYSFNLKPGSSFNKIRAYIQGQNLFVLTKYSGSDPEARLADIEQGGANAILSPGIDRRNTYYMVRTMTFGLSLGF